MNHMSLGGITIAWVAVTAVLVVLLIRRSLISMREDDQLFIDSTQSSLAAEQRDIQAKLRRQAPLTKAFGFTSAALLLTIAGVWIHRMLTRFAQP
jgi:Tfp pilus assembly protein PilN